MRVFTVHTYEIGKQMTNRSANEILATIQRRQFMFAFGQLAGKISVFITNNCENIKLNGNYLDGTF